MGVSRGAGNGPTIVLVAVAAFVATLTTVQAEPPEVPVPSLCAGVEVVPLFAKPTVILNTVETGDFDRWRSRGEFIDSASFVLDPVSNAVTLILSQATTVYQAVVPPGTFEQRGQSIPYWLFRVRRNDPEIPGAEGWRLGRLRKRAAKVGALNRVRFGLRGSGVPIPVDLGFVDPLDPAARPLLRLTLHFGDICLTAKLSCSRRNNNRKLRCFSLLEDPPSSASGAFVDGARRRPLF